MAGRTPYHRHDRMQTTDPYRRETLSLHDPSVCNTCKAVWHKGKWFKDEKILKEVQKWEQPKEIICPACKRADDSLPCGIVSLRGKFLENNKEQILNTIKNEEKIVLSRDPLDRIISLEDKGATMTIQTTDTKLAQRIGRAIAKSCGGKLMVKFSHEDKLVRVYWERN